MHTLAFVNQKGGCGKTTSAVQLAGALARRGDRVLLVDLDPQAHATLALGCAPDGAPTVADVLHADAPTADALVPATGGLTLLPSDGRLAEFEEAADRVLHAEGFLAAKLAELTSGSGRRESGRRESGRRESGRRDAGATARFDYVLVDCPPRADGVLAANALRAAQTVVLVVETGVFALQGAVKAMAILRDVASSMDTSFELRVLSTLFDERLSIARELLIGTQARFGEVMFETVVHESVRLREAAAFGALVHQLDPDCVATRDFAALADEVEAHVARADRAARIPDPAPEGRPDGARSWMA